MLIIFVFSTIKAYGVDNKYETIIKNELENKKVPENFINECKAEVIDTSKLLVDGEFNEKPSSVIGNFIEREYKVSLADYNCEKEMDKFKTENVYKEVINKYKKLKDFPEDLKLAIAFLIHELAGLEKKYNIITQLKRTYKVLRLLEYESEFLLGLQNIDNIKTTSINIPSGKEVIIGGIETDVYNEPYFLIIDFGGDDKYIGPAASSVGEDEVSIVLDLGGNDLYENMDPTRGSQGSADKGIAVLLDFTGDDVYKSISNSQGSGLNGGVGILWDKIGNDSYYSFKLSQGFGGANIFKRPPYKKVNNKYIFYYNDIIGFGLLLDSKGDDIYNVGNLPGESSPHLSGISLNSSQGAAYGSGGVGMLIDLKGDDVYKANIRAQGIGWFCGKGVLFDKEGNDLYFGIQYAQGAAAHGGTGVFFDKSGDDYYYIKGSQGLGSGKDLDPEYNQSVAIFLDESGNDEYYFKEDSCGVGIDGGIGYFIDMNGEDVYKNIVMGNGSLWDENIIYKQLNILTLGLFYDQEGMDSYPKEAPITNHKSFIRRPDISPGVHLNPQGYQLGLLIDK